MTGVQTCALPIYQISSLLITNKLEKKISALCKVGLCVCDDDIWFIMSGFFWGGVIQGITLYISGIDQWKVSTFPIQLDSELVLNNGHLDFTRHVSSI